MGNCVKSKNQNSNLSTSAVGGKRIQRKQTDTIAKYRRQTSRLLVHMSRNENYDCPSAVIMSKDKSREEVSQLRQALLSNSVLCDLSEEELSAIISKMNLFEISSGHLVCSQGNPGHHFFVVARGSLEVSSNSQVIRKLSPWDSFGELALMHDTVRTATIRTIEHSELWGIHKSVFKAAVKSISNKNLEENLSFLRSAPFFSQLQSSQLAKIVQVCVQQNYSDEQVIIREGDPGYQLYFVKTGKVQCSKGGNFVRYINPGDFFGEHVFIYNNSRSSTVIACGDVSVLTLKREAIAEVLGDQLESILYKNSLRIALSRSKILGKLTEFQIDSIIDRIEILQCVPGDILTRDKIWVILKGNIENLEIFKCLNEEVLSEQSSQTFKDIQLQDECYVGKIEPEEIERQLGGPLTYVYALNKAKSVMKSISFFSSLPAEAIEKLANLLKIQEFQHGDTIFAENDPGTAFYIVKRGKLDLFRSNVFVRTITKNGYFGERSLIGYAKWSSTVIAKTDCVLWVLNRNNSADMLEGIIQKHIALRMAIEEESIQLEELLEIESLGNSDSGDLYKVVHSSKNIRYVARAIQKKKIVSKKLEKILQEEHELLMKVDHLSIARLFRTFNTEDHMIFLMEHVKGVDMQSMIKKGVLCTNAQFYAGCLIDIAHYLHELNIVYRNFNPDVFMIDEDGYPKLLNLKSAKEITSMTYTMIGTPHYTAPEVIKGTGYSTECDFWSIGVVIHEIATKILPFGDNEEDPIEIYEKILKAELEFTTELNEQPLLQSFLETLLDKDPSIRKNWRKISHHPWLEDMKPEILRTKSVKAHYLPHTAELPYEALVKKGVPLTKVISEGGFDGF